MNSKFIFIIVSLFWFGSDGTSRGKETDPLSIPGRLQSLDHYHVERRQSISKRSVSNPCLKGSLSMECKMYQWKTMKGSNKTLNDTERKYFNSFGSTGQRRMSAQAQSISTPKLRKEYRCLTNQERQNLHNALNEMKSTLAGNQTEYDVFVLHHTFENAPEAHWGPAFLGFHREYLLRFEQALQTHCPSCMLPYWDNRCEGRLKGNVQYSILFSGDLLGNAVGYVTTGFAQKWKTVNTDCLNMYPNLYRDIDTEITQLFPENAEDFVKVNQFQDMCYPWNYTFESIHCGPHMFIGGLMSYIACAPNDPIFFMHHCFIDNFFQRFKNYSMTNSFSLQYPDISQKNLPLGFDDTDLFFSTTQGANHAMLPFPGLINANGFLSDTYTTLYYQYDTSPGDINCTVDSDCCNSTLFWCDNGVSHKCIPKVVQGGLCDTTFPNSACYCKTGIPSNNQGTCRCL